MPNRKLIRKTRPTRSKRKAPPPPQRPSRKGSKQGRLITLLQRPGGATIDDLVKATGWQRHTVRGAISSALRKRLHLTVVSERSETGERVYKIPASGIDH